MMNEFFYKEIKEIWAKINGVFEYCTKKPLDFRLFDNFAKITFFFVKNMLI